MKNQTEKTTFHAHGHYAGNDQKATLEHEGEVWVDNQLNELSEPQLITVAFYGPWNEDEVDEYLQVNYID